MVTDFMYIIGVMHIWFAQYAHSLIFVPFTIDDRILTKYQIYFPHRLKTYKTDT